MIGLSEEEKKKYRRDRRGKVTGSGGFDSERLAKAEAEMRLAKEFSSRAGSFADQIPSVQQMSMQDTGVIAQQGLTTQDAASAVMQAGGTVLAAEGAKMLAKEAGKEVAKEGGKMVAKEGAKTAATAGMSAGASAGIGIAGKIGGDMIDEGGTTTSTSKGVAGGIAKGASTGAAFGPWGAAIGGAVGGISGALSAKSNRKKKEAEAQAKMHQELGRIEGEKTDRLNKALSGLADNFSRTLV